MFNHIVHVDMHIMHFISTERGLHIAYSFGFYVVGVLGKIHNHAK